MYKFCDVKDNNCSNTTGKRTTLQAEFTSYISVASAVPSLIFLILNTALSHKYVLYILASIQNIFIIIIFILGYL